MQVQHKVGPQGLIVTFGYVTAEDGEGRSALYQQGQMIPPGCTITAVEGENENDSARSTAKLLSDLGIGGKAKTGGKGPVPVEEKPVTKGGE